MAAQAKRNAELEARKVEQIGQESNANQAAPANQNQPRIDVEQAESVKRLQLGDFFSNSGMAEKKKFFTIESDLLKIKLLNQGGRVYSVELKDYQTYDSMPLILFDSDTSSFGFTFFNQAKNNSDQRPVFPSFLFNK